MNKLNLTKFGNAKSVQRRAAQEAQTELDMAMKQIYIVHENLGYIKL